MKHAVAVPQTRHSRIEVDRQILRDNIRKLGELTEPGTKHMAVVKANAYGHGAVETARAVMDEVSWFGVAHVDEAIELREAGIELPILVFGVPEEHTASLYKTWNLTAVISDLAHFDLLPEGTHAHLHFDTGMNRLGIRPDQLTEVHSCLDATKLSVNGIMSHLACADAPGSAKTRRQIDVANLLFSKFPPEWERHIHNTGGILHHYRRGFSMVRHGIGMYGYDPAREPSVLLQPALQWTSRVVQCKPIKAGETVSYGARWQAERDGWLLAVPVGYADGLPRNLTAKLSYNVRGEPLEVRGVVTMDYTMLFSDHPVSPGTEVTVLGGDATDARRLAEDSGTISYEILSRIAPKVPRSYI